MCEKPLPPGVTVCPDDGFDLLGTDATVTGARVSEQGAVVRDSMVGQRIGDYEVRRRIGQGAAGVVYEAIHQEIGRRVAIKVLQAGGVGSTGGGQGLLEEARLAASIRHRGIIEVYSFGVMPDGGHYIVMEFLEGQSLDELLKAQGPMHLSDALDVVDEVLSALSAAHARKVVHRDLKPSNIFLVQQTGGRFVKLLDFGLAKRLRQGESYYTAATEPNVILGTPDYMAPEQGMGADVTARSDLYAVGCILFELLSGRPPFQGKGALDVALKHITEPPPALTQLMPSILPAVSKLILRLMEKEPARRPASADEVRTELKKIREAIVAVSTQPVTQSDVEKALLKAAPISDTSPAVPPRAAPPPSESQAPLAAVPEVAPAPARRGPRPLIIVIAAAAALAAGLLLWRFAL